MLLYDFNQVCSTASFGHADLLSRLISTHSNPTRTRNMLLLLSVVQVGKVSFCRYEHEVWNEKMADQQRFPFPHLSNHNYQSWKLLNLAAPVRRMCGKH